MNYISMENWDIIRDVLGLMICLVSILCLVKSKENLKDIF